MHPFSPSRLFAARPFLLLLLLPVLLTLVAQRSLRAATVDDFFVGDDTAAGDGFGWSLALDGTTLVVGAYQADLSVKEKAGAAYVFEYDGDAWQQVHKLTASDGVEFDQFGAAVAIEGDLIAVGANHKDIDGNSQQGAVYLFARDESGAGQWGEVTRLTASDGTQFDNLGDSVAIVGGDVLVGAAFLFQQSAPAGAWTAQRRWRPALWPVASIWQHTLRE